HNVRTCDGCTKKGTLLDRKNVRLPVRCNGAVRTVFNPIPIYMGDKLTEMPIDYAILYFTIETKKECADVIRKFTNAEPFGSEFTRGLYFKGTI
ncbi:MAG: U32 family peptidase, partial [Oscillospiraceae bacterium]